MHLPGAIAYPELFRTGFKIQGTLVIPRYRHFSCLANAEAAGSDAAKVRVKLVYGHRHAD